MKKHLLFLSLFVINVLMAQLPNYVPTDGLQAWYPFAGNANDESGNNLNGTVIGANLTTDRFNTQNAAYSFAENQEIFIPNTENLNTYPLTISLWYNTSSLEDGMASNIFSKYVPAAWNGFQILLSDCRNVLNNGANLNNGFGVQSWYLRDNNNRVIGYFGESPFLQQNISSNVWYHYVFVLDENGGKIYLNGQLIDSHPWTGTSGPSTNQYLWKIGGYYASWFKGKIDDIGVWNRALTAQEITNLYNSSLPQTTCLPAYVPTNGLMGYWPFCGNANDESGNGNNGTVNGATLTTDRFGSINNSYQFIENTDIISIANTTINPQDFTISGWCKLNSPFVYTTFSILEIANLDYTTPGGIGLHMTQNDGIFGNGNYKVYGFSSNNAQVDSDILSYNFVSNWNHIVVVKQNGTIKLFINNVLISTSPATQITDFTNAWLQIGSRQNINNNPLSSRNIDDIGIWNRALTQEEITNLYNSSLPQTACLPAYVPTNGLMGYWPFCGNANDESGNGNNGTIHGTTLISDRFGNNNSAYSFNGSSNYISIPYSSSIGVQQNISVSFWVYMNGGGCGPRILQSQPWGQCGGYYITTNSNSNVSRSFGGSIDDCNIGVGGSSSAELNSLSWHHVIFTASGLTGTYQFYYDGTLVNSTNTNQFFSSINYNNHTLIIGNIDPNSCNWFGGYLDDIGIWNRILTQLEITDLNTSLSTEQPLAKNQITIYPNPTKEKITIDCGNTSNTSGWSYKIINSLGQEVLNGEISSQQNVVLLNSLNGTGVYFVKIYDASNNLLNTKKIILQ